MIFGGLIFMLLLCCQKENEILPENARLKEILHCSSLNMNETIWYAEEYEYNKLGQISKVSTPTYYNLYDYNSSGQLIKITNYYSNSTAPTGSIILKIYTYFYSDDGKKEKEYIEYPQINSSEYSLYIYKEERLEKIEKYDYSNELTDYTLYEYDALDQPVREIVYSSNNMPFRWTINTFSNGLMIKSEIYRDENLELKWREIKRTFDVNKNIKILESIEGPYGSSISYVLRYVYYGE